jgi:queuosine precursor transporter
MLLPRSRRTREGVLFLVAFIATIPLANWMIGNVGTVCPPGEPCLIPVAPGLMAPSGVIMVGLALTLRDLVQRRLGLGWGAGAILIGGALSWFVAPPALVVASVAAFLFSEFADLAVFTPLQKRGLVLAVVVSSMVGILVDSAIFLFLAFGDLSHFWGQAIGKGWMVLLAIPFIHLLRRRDTRLGLAPRGIPA